MRDRADFVPVSGNAGWLEQGFSSRQVHNDSRAASAFALHFYGAALVSHDAIYGG